MTSYVLDVFKHVFGVLIVMILAAITGVAVSWVSSFVYISKDLQMGMFVFTFILVLVGVVIKFMADLG